MNATVVCVFLRATVQGRVAVSLEGSQSHTEAATLKLVAAFCVCEGCCNVREGSERPIVSLFFPLNQRIHLRKEIDFQKAAHLTLCLQPSAKILQPVVSEGKYVSVHDWFKVHSVYVGGLSAATVRFTPWTQGNS